MTRFETMILYLMLIYVLDKLKTRRGRRTFRICSFRTAISVAEKISQMTLLIEAVFISIFSVLSTAPCIASFVANATVPSISTSCTDFGAAANSRTSRLDPAGFIKTSDTAEGREPAASVETPGRTKAASSTGGVF